MKPKVKKYAIGLAAAFVAIVATLTASQHILTQKAIANAVSPYNGAYDDTEANANLTTVLVRADRDLADELSSRNLTYTAVSSPLKTIENTEGEAEAVLAVEASEEESSVPSSEYYSYIVDLKSPSDVASASEKLDLEGVDVNKDFVFHIAGPSGSAVHMDANIPDIDIEAQLNEGKTLRQIADENGLKLVAVIDTGVNNYASYSIDFTGSGIEDKNGHGTRVAEKILNTANGKAMIISLKAMDDDGTGKMTNVFQAVEYAKAQQVDIINMSIAAYDNGTVESDTFRASVESAVLNNIVVVAAAGNYSSNAARYIPAGIPGVISVGTMTEDRFKTHESNYGDITYYEQTDTSSEAAAIVSGKIAGDAPEEEFTKGTSIAINKEDVIDDEIPTEDGSVFKTQGTWQYISASVKAGSGTFTLYVGTETGDFDLCTKVTSWSGYVWVNDSYANSVNLGVRVYAYPDTANHYAVDYISLSGHQTNYSGWDGNGNHYSWTADFVPNGDASVGVYFKKIPGGTLNVNQHVSGIRCPGTNNIAEFTSQSNIGSFSWNVGGTTGSGVDYSSFVNQGTRYDFNKIKSGDGLYLQSVKPNRADSMPNGSRTIDITHNFVTLTIDPGANGTYDNAEGQQQISSSTLFDTSRLRTVPSDGTHTVVTGNPWTSTSLTLKKPNPGYYYVTLDPGAEVGSPQRDRIDPELDNTNPWRLAETVDPSNVNGRDCHAGSISGLTYKYGNTNDRIIPNALYPVTFPVPEKYGYEFQGWYTAKNGGGTRVSVGNETKKLPLTSDTTYYAHFVQKNVTLKVQADVNSGNKILDSFPDVGKFNITYQTGVTTDSSGNKVPVMKTEKNLTSFNKSLKYGSTYEITNITPTDYYQYDASSTRNKNHKGKVQSDTTATIAFKGIPYTVEFNNNDDGRGNLRPTGSVPSVSGTYGLPVKLPTQTFAWRGREFKYWSNNKDADPLATAYLVPGQTTLEPQKYIDLKTKKATLYAIWEVHETTVTVKPSPGNYNGNTDPIYFTNAPGITQEIPIPTPPAGSITIKYDKVAKDAVLDHTSDVTYWAFKDWTINDDADGKLEDSTHYTHGVTFDTLQANYFYASVPLPTPTRKGYTFLGWYEDAKYIKKAGNAGATNYHAPGNITLYARWYKNNWEYSDDVEFFVNDQKGDQPKKLIFRKEDADSGLGMTSVKVDGKEYTFKFNVYEGSISDANLKFKIDSKLGLLSRTGASLNKKPNENAYIDLTDSLTVGKTYIIHETDAAPGYELAKDLKFTYNDNAMKRPITVSDRKFSSPPGDDIEKPNKKDEYGRPISNVTVQARDTTAGGTVTTVTTDEDGVFTKDVYSAMQAGHNYTFVETESVEGFGSNASTNVTMPTSADAELPEIELINTVIKKELEIKKTSADNKPLAGAEFQLFVKTKDGVLIPAMHDASGKWVDPVNPPANAQPYIGTSNTSGLLSFKNLPMRATFTGSEPDYTKSYYLVELKAPPGYVKLPHEVEIRIPDDGKAKVTYTAKDGMEKLTLSAGGSGAYLYLVGGGMLILAAGLVLITKKRTAVAE